MIDLCCTFLFDPLICAGITAFVNTLVSCGRALLSLLDYRPSEGTDLDSGSLSRSTPAPPRPPTRLVLCTAETVDGVSNGDVALGACCPILVTSAVDSGKGTRLGHKIWGFKFYFLHSFRG